MKNQIASSALRLLTLAVAFALPAIALAADSSRAAELLARDGSVAVKNAGPYVETGTFQIQVLAKLGQPTAKLGDGTWLYPHYEVENTTATGTLVVKFNTGRVSQLSLVTPRVAIAMLTAPKLDKIFVAARN